MRKFIYKYILPRFYHVLFGINIAMKELDLTDKKCLCLAPHPDDESIGMGGTLAKYPDNFEVVCLTDGRRAASSYTTEELIKVREEEFKNAIQKAGIKNFKLIGMPDKQLILNSFDNKIDISQYDIIFLPNIMDQHRDHKSVSPYVNMLLKTGKYKKDLQIGFYEVWSTLALPNYFVDITETKNKKTEMINSHKSQLREYDYTNKALSLNFFRGLPQKREYSECFMIVDIKLFKKILKASGLL